MKYTCSMLLFFCLYVAAAAQNAGFDLNANCREAYKAILHYDLEGARQIIGREQIQHPTNSFPLYLQNYADFMEAMVRDEEHILKAYEEASDKRLEKLKAAGKNSPYYHFCIAEVHLQNALLLIKEGNYLQGAMQLWHCYKHLESNEKEHPGFLLTGKTLYPLKALIGSVPSNYRWLLNLMGYDADLSESIRQADSLRQRLQADSAFALYYNESTATLAYLQLNLMNNADEAWRLIKEATGDYAQNPVSAFFRANIALNVKKNDEAIAVLRPQMAEAPSIPHLDYLMANALLQKLQPRARFYFLRYIKNYEGRNYVKDSYLRIGWSYLIEGDTASYHTFMLITSREGAEVREEDKQAMKEVAIDYGAVPYLLKSRLLFDGGYYTEALQELETATPAKAKAAGRLTEFYYRRARIYHHSGKPDQALADYAAVIDAGKNDQTYFPPASCYFSGLIYEEKGKMEEAAAMYNACLAFDDYSYKKSFDQKASAALKRIRKNK